MRKLIAAINLSLDGFCDHTLGVPDEEIHMHYADLLASAGAVLYGRTTYQLMEFWRTLAKVPSGEEAMDKFALVMDNTPKIVFSRTLKELNWHSATLANRELKDEVIALKAEEGKDIYAGSPSMIAQLTELDLIDEYQLCIHPVIAGIGLPLFKNMTKMRTLNLVKTKVFGAGAVVLYYGVRE